MEQVVLEYEEEQTTTRLGIRSRAKRRSSSHRKSRIVYRFCMQSCVSSICGCATTRNEISTKSILSSDCDVRKIKHATMELPTTMQRQ